MPTATPRPPLSALDCSDAASEIIGPQGTDGSILVDITLIREINRQSHELVCKGLFHLENNDVSYPAKFILYSSGYWDLGNLEIIDFECDYLVAGIIALSEESLNLGARNYRILKIYDPYEVERTADKFSCQGFARTSSGDWDILFHAEADEEGERFIGYRRIQ